MRLLSARRADRAWKALLDQVHARSEAVVDTLLAACSGSTLRRLVAGAAGQVSTHPLMDEGCVGELGVQRVLLTLRRHFCEGGRFSLAETEAGPSERFGVAELRRHRTEMRRVFEKGKEELWTSVIRAALLEARALVVRMEARCSDAEIESFRRCLSNVIDGGPTRSRRQARSCRRWPSTSPRRRCSPSSPAALAALGPEEPSDDWADRWKCRSRASSLCHCRAPSCFVVLPLAGPTTRPPDWSPARKPGLFFLWTYLWKVLRGFRKQGIL